MTIIISRMDFDSAAKALVLALHTIIIDHEQDARTTTTTTTTTNTRENFKLAHWELKKSNDENVESSLFSSSSSPSSSDGSLYLVHPPIITYHSRQRRRCVHGKSDDRENVEVNDDDADDGEEELQLEDDSVYVDLDSYLPAHDDSPAIHTTRTHDYNNNNNNDKDLKTNFNNDDRTMTTILPIQWNFSIVYSDTFQIPVLYFHVQTLRGEPCSRSEVLEWLLEMNSKQNQTQPTEMEVDDSWEFLSQEEHPCTRLPSFFLHPCQTPALLTTLLQTMTTTTTIMPPMTTTTMTSTKTPTNDTNANSTNPVFLWAWLSLILGAVGHSIPGDFYVRVQTAISGYYGDNQK